MEMPKNYEAVQPYGDYTKLPAGGYVCKIMGVEESQTRNNQPMIIVSLDIAEGDNAGFFDKAYKTDTRPDKTWGCRMFQMTIDPQSSDASRGFKSLMTSIKESNAGFNEVWGADFCASLKGKLLGVIFREEEYIGQRDGALHTSVKPFVTRSADTIRKGDFTVPDIKRAEDARGVAVPQSSAYVPQQYQQGFQPLVSDNDLPF